MFWDIALLKVSPSSSKFLKVSPASTEFVVGSQGDSSVVVGSSVVKLTDLVVNLDMIGGAIWVVWGTVVLASSLKDKNGPGLQSGIWQIVGGLMIMVVTKVFKNLSDNKYLLNDVMQYGAKFCSFGGALWAIWGVVILAGALRDKTGPVLQSAIWQIVGGLMIILASSLFTQVVKVS